VTTRSLARLTGWLYLVIIVCAGFSEGYARATLIVPEDPAATAANILEHEGLFRMALASDLVAFMAGGPPGDWRPQPAEPLRRFDVARRTGYG
jgi:hypothetical protein